MADARTTAALTECVATFRRYLHLPDPGALLVTLATVAANRTDGDPLWTLLVAPPGGGKTELLGALSRLPNMHVVGTFTEAALLSGTPEKERSSSAKGGLLREIGDFGIIVAKDFGSVLSMHRDARSAVLAALREIYDGSWARHVGSNGGRALTWTGKVGFIGAVTSAIDSHNAVMGSLGERFVLFRWPDIDQDAQARAALRHLGRERGMREDLASAVRAVLDVVDQDGLALPPTDELREELVSLSALAARCRSAVERDGFTREITLIPEPEAPARLVIVPHRLYNGLSAIGTDSDTARRLVAKAALDSMPQLRRRVLEQLVHRGRLNSQQIAHQIGYSATTTRRGCEDLAAHKVLQRDPSGSGKQDIWSITDWTQSRWPSVPETSDETNRAYSGVPETSQRGVKAQHNSHNQARHTFFPRLEEDNSGKLYTQPADDAPPPGDADDRSGSSDDRWDAL